jgi:hypothetical protein
MPPRTVDLSQLLDVVPDSEYKIVNVYRHDRIDNFVENTTDAPYVKGSAFYQLTKKETIQPTKIVFIQDKKNGKVYQVDKARSLLGIPKVKCHVYPDMNPDYDVYIQSTSLNRVLVGGTKLLVLGL